MPVSFIVAWPWTLIINALPFASLTLANYRSQVTSYILLIKISGFMQLLSINSRKSLHIRALFKCY